MRDIIKLINIAARASEGMSDYQHVDDTEDAEQAAEEIVSSWEKEGTGILSSQDGDLELTDEEYDEVRARCVANIRDAIESMRDSDDDDDDDEDDEDEDDEPEE